MASTLRSVTQDLHAATPLLVTKSLLETDPCRGGLSSSIIPNFLVALLTPDCELF